MSYPYRISCPSGGVKGTIVLEPSKSISNRALIIQSLCNDPFEIHRLSESDDTQVLREMLTSQAETLHSRHAGSSYRFMVARACLGEREVVLDASDQLRRRPIGPLVKALQTIGADITYLKKEGFPPLSIKPAPSLGKEVNEIHLHAGISSQYISALLMIAPCLPQGLKIHLTDDIVSVPYIKMTLDMMGLFGVGHEWEERTITIPSTLYVARDFSVEGDWSAASYFFSIAALAGYADIHIEGLFENSLQGDAVVKEIYNQLGVRGTFTTQGIRIEKEKEFVKPDHFKYDFIDSPDLAQTVMVTLAGLGIKGILSGLKTLRIKETDRIVAIQTELAKIKTNVEILVGDGEVSCRLTGKAKWKDKAKFDTYEDHRMAMSLTPLGGINPILVRNPDVVKKSYPGFWKDVAKIGLKIETIRGKV